jgi:dihydrofolate reductase
VRLSLLVAMDERGGIGLGDGLPWRLPDDLKRFKQLTMQHFILMGRKTCESIGRPLPGRQMVVITRQPGFSAPGCQVAPSLQAALELAAKTEPDEVFVIGGGQIFALALPLADRIHLTRVHTVTPADVFFPDFDTALWKTTYSEFHPADERHVHAFTFQILDRIASPKP